MKLKGLKGLRIKLIFSKKKEKKEKNFLRKFTVIAEENSIESSGKFMGPATFFYIDPIARDPQSVI